MPRLDIDRQKALEPTRIKRAMDLLKEMGYDPREIGTSKIAFNHFKGSRVTFWPYSGWHSGKDIEDGRGLEHLLNQL